MRAELQVGGTRRRPLGPGAATAPLFLPRVARWTPAPTFTSGTGWTSCGPRWVTATTPRPLTAKGGRSPRLGRRARLGRRRFPFPVCARHTAQRSAALDRVGRCLGTAHFKCEFGKDKHLSRLSHSPAGDRSGHAFHSEVALALGDPTRPNRNATPTDPACSNFHRLRSVYDGVLVTACDDIVQASFHPGNPRPVRTGTPDFCLQARRGRRRRGSLPVSPTRARRGAVSLAIVAPRRHGRAFLPP
ncbi:uncharacterized protein LOC133397384 isoform X2 [Phycodurus eques]|uniref:uncharacterized protein LOC133397384 isoform X2 n=1 Tax=Phycodurus eques TaxID=693459 RepID=UPI002ACDFEAB|nr:uncharacterized protein LOC133397384 isoform X2 [Phycodurus eques]